jgi:spore coat protein U-like protein
MRIRAVPGKAPSGFPPGTAAKHISAIFFALLLMTRPALALLCGSFLDPITVSATSLNFGVYVPSGAATANTTVTVACTIPLDLLTDFRISLSAGNALTDPSARYLKAGGNRLGYNIYTDGGYMTVWGDGTAGSVDQGYSSLLALGSASFTGFGRLPQGQYVPAGSYTDRITVTVSF